MYLLDTDTVIHILKGNPVVEANVRKQLHCKPRSHPFPIPRRGESRMRGA